MNTQDAIEDAMADIMSDPDYPKIVAEWERLLAIVGNVEEQVIALSLLAAKNVKS